MQAFTVEMLVECAVGSVLEHHHPCEGLLFLAVAQQVDEILVVYSGQACYLKPHSGQQCH
jgi:hypothetical protein